MTAMDLYTARAMPKSNTPWTVVVTPIRSLEPIEHHKNDDGHPLKSGCGTRWTVKVTEPGTSKLVENIMFSLQVLTNSQFSDAYSIAEPNPKSGLLALGLNILTHLFTHLPADSAICLALTCKSLYALYASLPHLQSPLIFQSLTVPQRFDPKVSGGGCTSLILRLREWMGKGYEYCATCNVFVKKVVWGKHVKRSGNACWRYFFGFEEDLDPMGVKLLVGSYGRRPPSEGELREAKERQVLREMKGEGL